MPSALSWASSSGRRFSRRRRYVFANVHGPWLGLGCWLLGGVLALIGSLCYAELATTYPRMGGDYVYLTRAFGRWVGFLFGWAQLTVILTGSIGAMAYAFGDYAVELFGWAPSHSVWLAVGSVVVLTVLNLFGVVFGKTVQNLLTAVKILGLGAIVVAGFVWGGDASWASQKPMAGTGIRAGDGVRLVRLRRLERFRLCGRRSPAPPSQHAPGAAAGHRRHHDHLPAGQRRFPLGLGL